MNKRGALLDLIVLMVVAFIAVLFFVGFVYTFNLVTSEMLGLDENVVNVTQATNATFVNVNNSLAGLKWFAAAIIFGSIIGIMVSNFLVKAHPVFFVPYILFVILSVVFSAYISNAYEAVLNQTLLQETLLEFSFTNFFFLNLPVWITVIGILGGIALFIGITVDRDLGGGIT